MAGSRTHLTGTICIMVASWLRSLTTNLFLFLDWHYVLVMVVTFCSGFLVDVDHFFHWKRVKETLQIRKQDHISFTQAWRKSEGKKANLFHTWPMAVLIILGAWFLTHSFLPIIAYCFHILIDVFDAGYASKRNFWEIPGCLGQLVPKRLRYKD